MSEPRPRLGLACLLTVLALASAALLAGCGGGGSDGAANEASTWGRLVWGTDRWRDQP